MKVVIPSKGRSETIKTHKLFDDYVVVLHNENERKAYVENAPKTGLDTSKIVVSGVPFGVSFQRNWIIENLVERGEWFLTADDNIEAITKLEGTDNLPISEDEFWNIVSETLGVAGEWIHYCGFAVVDNYYFREKHFRFVGYVISKLALIRNKNIKYDTTIKAMDDYGYTAENLLRYGKVLINNWVYPQAPHYQEGGIGTYEDRLERKIEDCKYLMFKYPNLFRYKKKAGCHPKAELQVRFTSLEQVEKWRKEMLVSNGSMGGVNHGKSRKKNKV
jgi:hypothetical protein